MITRPTTRTRQPAKGWVVFAGAMATVLPGSCLAALHGAETTFKRQLDRAEDRVQPGEGVVLT